MSTLEVNETAVLSLETDQQDFDVILHSADGQCITLPYSFCKISKLLCISDLSEEDNTVDLSLIPSYKILQKIGDYLSIHKGTEPKLIEKPLRTANLEELTIKDNIFYIDNILKEGGLNLLYEVLSAANYIQCNSLINLLCAKIASLIKGKPIDQIKTILNPNTSTTQE